MATKEYLVLAQKEKCDEEGSKKYAYRFSKNIMNDGVGRLNRSLITFSYFNCSNLVKVQNIFIC